MTKQPIILCCGQNGRCVIFGHVDKLPEPGEPVTLWDARMIIRWIKTGIFGIAAEGPEHATVTHAVEHTTETVWQEYIAVSATAAELFDALP